MNDDFWENRERLFPERANWVEILPPVTRHNASCSVVELHAPHHWSYGQAYYYCLGFGSLIPGED